MIAIISTNERESMDREKTIKMLINSTGKKYKFWLHFILPTVATSNLQATLTVLRAVI